MRLQKLLWTAVLLGVAACSPAAGQSEQPPSVTADSDATVETSRPAEVTEVAELPTPTAPVEATLPVVAETPAGEPATPEPDTVGVASGRTPEGAYFLGAEDAAVTMIDYSDFL
jgi:hypothetical protein